MRKILTAFTVVACTTICAVADDTEPTLADKIQTARNACSGISEQMNDMKKLAGINTAVTSVGTAAGAVGGLTSAAQSDADNNKYYIIGKNEDGVFNTIRTTSLGTAAVADTAGAIIAAKNHIDEDLQQRIDNCIAALNDLGDTRLRARAENTATPEDLATAQVIEIMCNDWKNVDLSSINKRATGAAISSGTGAALAAAGAIASSQYEYDDTVTDKDNRSNTASNALAGGATVASTVAIVFNAKQKSAIKKAVAAADKCEEGINQTQNIEQTTE